MLCEYHLLLGDLHRQFGPVVRSQLAGRTVIHVFQPEDIQTVYSVEGK